MQVLARLQLDKQLQEAPFCSSEETFRGSLNVGTDYEEINPAGQTFFDTVTSDRGEGPFSSVFFNKNGNNNNKNKTVRRLANWVCISYEKKTKKFCPFC